MSSKKTPRYGKALNVILKVLDVLLKIVTIAEKIIHAFTRYMLLPEQSGFTYSLK